jgi:2-C-methyl-D-erythritol 4-phosphate cytidylyltransferase
MGGGVPKQYLSVEGVPLIVLALESLAKEPRITAVQPVIARNDTRFSACIADRSFPFILHEPVRGGSRRAISMALGIKALGEEVEWVAVHDAARPVPSPALLKELLDTALEHGAAVPGLGVTDTVKRVDEDGRVLATLERHMLRAIQTPQVARKQWFDEAIRIERKRLHLHTDDASLLEAAGFPVFVSRGEADNRKITTAEDFDWLRRKLSGKQA